MRSSAEKSRTLTNTVSKGGLLRSHSREYSSKAADFDGVVGLPEMSRISAIERKIVRTEWLHVRLATARTPSAATVPSNLVPCRRPGCVFRGLAQLPPIQHDCCKMLR